jgi:hypothetical protein
LQEIFLKLFRNTVPYEGCKLAFLKAFPMGPLLGITSVMDLVTGSGSFFSAQSRTPVDLVCWLRSYADLKSEQNNVKQKCPN